jgi:hypothetical protein
MYSRNDLELIETLHAPYSGLLLTADAVAVYEALQAVTDGKAAAPEVVRALVVLARAHRRAPDLVPEVEAYVALAWHTTRGH